MKMFKYVGGLELCSQKKSPNFSNPGFPLRTIKGKSFLYGPVFVQGVHCHIETIRAKQKLLTQSWKNNNI